MKYENAIDLLPEQLLKEVQKYAAGKLLYVPSTEVKRAWGEASGYREQLQKRNRMIRNKYAHGVTISELADEYFLSLDSIKKIIYSKTNTAFLSYSPTLESAVLYAHAGLLEEWLHCYWLLTHKAVPIGYENYLYVGIVKFPLRLIQFKACDQGIDESDCHPAAAPPLLLEYEDGKFHCKVEQQSFLASLKQRKINAYPSAIVLKGNAEYKRFMKYYGNIFIYVKKEEIGHPE